MEVIFLTFMQVMMLGRLKDHLDSKLDRICLKIKELKEARDEQG